MSDWRARIDEFLMLPENWDSYGAARVDIRSAETMRTFIEAVGIDPWHIAPTSNGGMYVEWVNRPRAIDIDIEPDGILFNLLYMPDRSDHKSWHEHHALSAHQAHRFVRLVLV